jgi:hypothetical protein
LARRVDPLLLAELVAAIARRNRKGIYMLPGRVRKGLISTTSG